jgi:hypothetical protein
MGWCVRARHHDAMSGRRGGTADGSYLFENRFRYLIATVS